MADAIPVYSSPLPLDPADYETPQEAAAAAAPYDPLLSRFRPYPTGSPLSIEDEAARARGDLFKEPVEVEA